MAIDIYEAYKSRSGGIESSIELVYILTGSNDDSDLRDALEAEAPSTHEGLTVSDYTVEQLGPLVWKGTATYTPVDYGLAQAGENVWTFDTRGETFHLTQSSATSKYPSATAPDFQGAIGYNGESIEGVDVVIPTFKFVITKTFTDAEVTAAYKESVADATGTVNDAAFQGFSAREVLFLGASGSKRGSDDWQITFEFAMRRNLGSYDVGDVTVAEKHGWEYQWVLYERDEDQDVVIMKPKAVYVESLYAESDFGDLNL